MFHGELTGILLALRLLLTRPNPLTSERVMTIYSDSQAALQFLLKGNPTHSQDLFKSVHDAINSLKQRDI